MKGMKKIISICLIFSMIITNNILNAKLVLADNLNSDSYDEEYSVSTDSEIYEEEEYVEDSEVDDNENVESETDDKEIVDVDDVNLDDTTDIIEDDKISTASNAVELVDDIDIYNISSKSNADEIDSFDKDIVYPTGAVFADEDIIEMSNMDRINIQKKSNTYGNTDLPSSYDMRNFTNEDTGIKFVPEVKEQSFGDCWTFSTIAMFETNLRKKGLITDENTKLSESCVSYFTYGLHDVNNNDEYKGEPGVQGYDWTKLTTSTFAQRGGNQYMSTLAASSYMGVVVEDDESKYSNLAAVPKEELNNFSIDANYAYNRNSYILKNAYYMNKNSIDLIKQSILDYGAVGMNYFGEGEYAQRKKYSHQNPNDQGWYYWTDQSSYNHAISIIGWDDNKSAEYFYVDDGTEERNKVGTGPSSNGAWLCRNSWGKYSMSNEGYFWLSYEEPSLGSTMFAVEAEFADKYKYNYHYDSTGITKRLSFDKNFKPKFANVFKVSDDYDQSLDAVSVCLGSAQSQFEIIVYTKDTEMANPEDGTKQVTKSVSKDLSGVYTIELDDKIFLKKGSYFSIIVRLTATSDDACSLYTDFYDKGDWKTGYNYYNEAALSQSYFTYLKTTTTYRDWSDINVKSDDTSLKNITANLVTVDGITYGRNFRIKGLTNIYGDTKITFNNGEGEGSMNDQYVVSGEDSIIDLNKFTKTGYKFDKWVDANNNEYADGDTINISSDTELTAIFVPIAYTITYNAGKGTVDPVSFIKTYDTNESSLAVPTLTGHTFINWYKEESFENVYDGTEDLSTTENDNVSIYAKYEANTYNVTFETYGGTIKSGNITNYTYGIGATLPTDVEAEDQDDAFYGWYDNAEFNGDVVKEITSTDIGDKTYYAKYLLAYDITYVANNGTADTYVQKAFEGEETILKEIMFKRQGWTFNNWSADNGETYSNKQNIGVVASDMTLTANWTKNPEKNTNNNSSSSSGSDSSGGSSTAGPIANVNINANLNNNSNTNNKDISNNTFTVAENNVSWTKDQLTGNWKLSINTPLTGTVSASNGFVQISTVVNGQVAQQTYCFDANGNMLVGWVQTADKNWHYMDTNINTLGIQVQNSWKNVDGKFYYFDANGKLLTNSVAPNNMSVDANGALVDPTGLFSIQLSMQNK